MKSMVEKMKGLGKDRQAIAMMTIGLILFLVVAVLCFSMMAMIILSLETIGKGLLYIAIAVGVIICTAALAKRFILEKGVM